MEKIVKDIRKIKLYRLNEKIYRVGELLEVSIQQTDWDNALILRNEYRRLQKLFNDILNEKNNK